MGDAYWLYKNVPTGTTVTVGDYIIPSSVTKPTYQTIPENLTVDPTDPTDATNRRYAPDYTADKKSSPAFPQKSRRFFMHKTTG